MSRSTRSTSRSSTRIASPPGQTCARCSDNPGKDISETWSNSRTRPMSCSTASNVNTSDSMIPASRATASAEMMVPDVPIASRPVESLKNAFTGRNMRLAARRAASMDLRSIRPPLKYFSVNTTHPIGKLSSAVGFWPWPRISSVLPPPISSTSRKPEFGGKLSVTPLNMRRASSIPDMTSIGWPRARSASCRNA